MSNDTTALEHVPFARAVVVIHSNEYDKDFAYTLQQFDPKRKGKRLVREERTTDGAGVVTTHRFFRPSGWEWAITPDLPPSAKGRWRHSFLDTHRLAPRREPSPEHVGESLFDVSFEKEIERQWLAVYSSTQAEIRASQEKGLAQILNDVLSWREPKEAPNRSVDWEIAYGEMVSFLNRQDAKAKPSTKEAFRSRFEESPLFRTVLRRINRVEHEIAEATAPQTKLKELVRRFFTGSKELLAGPTSLEIVTGDAVLRPRSLSSGEKHFLRILLENVRAEESSLLIDEPELSMHVDWQRDLIAAMRELNPKSQLILATHSPEIMADIEDSKIFKL